MLPNPVQPHSEGEVRLASSDPADAPRIDLNYLDDPHDVAVFIAVIRRALEIVDHWPGDGIGPLMVPPALAEAHGHTTGDVPSDALLEDMFRHYALTVYHETSTCRMGSVVDAELRVHGVAAPARRRRQRHADRRQRQHQRRRDHDRREGRRDDRRGPRGEAGRDRRLTPYRAGRGGRLPLASPRPAGVLTLGREVVVMLEPPVRGTGDDEPDEEP